MTNGMPADDAPRERTTVSAPTLDDLFAHKPGFLVLVLAVVTFVAYLPLLSGTFIWDDDAWTTGISQLLRDVSGLRSMWCHLTALQQYYPLTGTTFWLDYQLWGFWTLPYHVENVLLHVLAALLFWRLLCRLQVPGAWLAGGIFALHPVMVDSAGWITERKNVLSLVLYLGALLVYGRWTSFWKADNDSAPCADNSPPHWRDYLLAWLLALGALLAKATAFSLPAVILLIGWWKRGRIRWRADVLPTVPFFALAIGLGLVTASVEKNHVGASGPEWAISFPERCLIAGRALVFYISKLLWPVNLGFVYPRWQLDAHSWWQWLYPGIAGATVLGLWGARRRIGRGPAAAAFFFVGTLFPVLGFMNAFFMRYSFVCDHWVYLSSLGVIALAAAGMTTAFKFFQPRRVILESVFYGTLLLMLGACTWRHAHIYHDVETVWRDTLTKNPRCWMAQDNLGVVLTQLGRTQEAKEHYEQALRIKPDFADAYNNLGTALYQTGQFEEAIKQYQQALQLKPDYADAYNNLGTALRQTGKFEEAIEQYQQALRLTPDYAAAHCNLGNVLLQEGKISDAIGHYEQALRSKPDYADAHYNLANVLLQEGKISDAIGHYEQALRSKPDYAEAHYNLGCALAGLGKVQEAMGHWEQALRSMPDCAELHYSLGVTLEQAGRVTEARGHYEQALRSKPDYAEAHYRLGAALGQAGRIPEAMEHLQQAVRINPDFAEAHYNLGVALEKLGRTQEAIQHYEQALRIKPDFTQAQNALARLQARQ
jgi:tetratricopeptide (TPR) repeat protein